MSVSIVSATGLPTDVFAGTTTRTGGVSENAYAAMNLGDHVGDLASAVAENRRRLRQFAGFVREPLWLQQVHGNHVCDASVAGPEPVADASVSLDGSAPLVIMTADCLPILIASRKTRAVAAVHGGWRSLAAGIIENTVAALAEDRSQLAAWLGPAIAQSAFEVGDEVRQSFVRQNEQTASCFAANKGGRWQADLYGIARLLLADSGVASIGGGGLCTYADEERFFSYRRDGECGRMASFIVRKNT